jgi:hypothetical protein
MKNYSWLLLSAGLLTFACDGGKDSADEADADTDTDTDADTDSDTDADTIPNNYTSYEGWESFDYNDGSYPAGEFNCQIVWDLSGAAVNPMDGDCENCEFMFDVTYSLRDESYVYDDGACKSLFADSFGTYGYSSEVGGYIDQWVFGYYGTYYPWGEGSFSGSTFTYYYGYTDYPYKSYYYTYYQYGSIEVQ